MAEEHPGVAALKKGFEAFQTADMHTLSQLFADDIEFVVPGRNPLSGVFRGKIELFSFFGNLIRESKGTWRTHLRDVLANNAHAVALVRATANRNGKDLDVNGVAVFDTDEHGKIVRAVFTWEDQHAVDEFYEGALT